MSTENNLVLVKKLFLIFTDDERADSLALTGFWHKSTIKMHIK